MRRLIAFPVLIAVLISPLSATHEAGTGVADAATATADAPLDNTGAFLQQETESDEVTKDTPWLIVLPLAFAIPLAFLLIPAFLSKRTPGH